MKCKRCNAVIPSGEVACDTCGTVVPQDEGELLPPGTVLAGKYQIQEQIGVGGMGRVYRAIQTPLGNEVCVKTLHNRATNEPQFATRFMREAKTTSQLRHPNIVTVFDFGTHTDGSMYLVMELIKGQSLAKLISRKKYLPPERIVGILGQLCDGLTVAHEKGVIHRDLKPANIMLLDTPGQQDFIKVLDFGSALMLEGEGSERLTQMGMVIGTPAYMAPEYIMGRGVTPRVDVYAVGVLLYRLLCGKLPFRGKAQAIYAQQVSVKPEPPSKKSPEIEISPSMDAVVMRTLVKDPAERYATATALKEAMEKALRGELADDEYSIEIDSGGGVSVEVAVQERAVVVVSVDLAQNKDEELVKRISALAESHGAGVQTSESGLDAIFGFTQEGDRASVDATGFAERLQEKEEGLLKLGIFDDQSSYRGKPGLPGFQFKLFGEGREKAARLSRLATAGQILVSGLASRGVVSEYQLIPTDPPEDFNDPVFMVSSVKEGDERVGRSLFVGRESEKQSLVELAVQATAGQVCLLLGPEGIGKSRLVDEVAPQVGHLDVQWCVVPATAHGVIGPTHPAGVLSALGWGITDGSASTTYRYMVHLMLGRAEETVDGLRGDRRLLRLVSAAISGLQQRLEHGPVVVVFDDMHDADDLTWTLAQQLVEMAPVIGVNVVICMRDERLVPFSLPDTVKRIEVGLLAKKETQLWLRTELGDRIDETTLETAAGISSGHPLLTQELIRALKVEQPTLLYALTEMTPEQSLTRLLEYRLTKLENLSMRILGSAAVLGGEPLSSEVKQLAGVDSDAFLTTMIELESIGLLHLSPGERVRFDYPRVAAATLGKITERSLAKIHLKAARIISGGDKAASRQVEMGEHLLRAGKHSEAFKILREAGLTAQDDGRKQLATRALSAAIEAGNNLGPEFGRQRSETARDLGRWLIQLGRLEDAEQLLRVAFRLAKEVNAGDVCSDLLRLHGRAIVLTGDVAGGRKEIEATLGYAEGQGDALGAAKAAVDLADAAERAGDREGRGQALKKGISLLEGKDKTTAAKVWIQLYNRMGRLEAETKNLPRAVALFAQALELAEQQEDHYQSAGLLGNLGGAYAQMQDAAKAIHYTERALRASENLGDQIGIARQSFNLALLRLTTGQRQTAKDLLRSCHEAASRAGWQEGLTMCGAAMAKLGMGK